MSTKRGAHCAAGRCYDCSGHLGCECDCHSETVTATSPADLDARIQAVEDAPAAEEGLPMRVADWLCKEYGEFLPDASDGYWEFQARELLEFLTTPVVATPVPQDGEE